MPRKFENVATVHELQQLLSEYQEGFVSATPTCCADFPLYKGIYFWYLSREGLDFLSERHLLTLLPSVNDIWLDDHLLIYIGTAGTRNTENNQGHLRQRLQWHILANHSESSILNGTLSTFRTTLGSLLNNDLISSEGLETKLLINDFLSNFLRVSYIKYEGDFDLSESINGDEKFLIQFIKPLFNLTHNANTKRIGHPTKVIKAKRIEVNFNTKTRLRLML